MSIYSLKPGLFRSDDEQIMSKFHQITFFLSLWFDWHTVYVTDYIINHTDVKLHFNFQNAACIYVRACACRVFQPRLVQDVKANGVILWEHISVNITDI